MTRKVLTPAAAMEVKRLYGELDERGNHRYSQMEIASMLGISETTVFRTVHKRGAYMALPEVPTEEAAKASEERFKAAHPELFADSAVGKMQAAVAEIKAIPERANAMLDDIRSPLDE